ncbi:hypothetical protein LV82_01284 [Albidovulum inexpectatum]|uniref:DUF4177 domain-containing protein n=1 Tax=Albidovulum inexpectatum TaxID=196587 RepID=A0A2S5JIR4_9RHOB|nr:DUF4177 domain-containing protein [Albidovulum inexpectatum]PPB81238.1 hypothetical protein LV82_01284 [Albidovulum inexpectatum]
MTRYEYRVVPAPMRGQKAAGAKTNAERFGAALTATINEMAAKGWEYLRSDTLPCEERAGFTRRTTVYHSMLVFRRPAEPAPRETAMNDDPAVRTPPAPRASVLRAAQPEPPLRKPLFTRPAQKPDDADDPDRES